MSPQPTGDKLIAYLNAVRAAAAKAYPDSILLADSWHMGWIARRIGRPLNHAPGDDPARTSAWQLGWDAARGTWEEVGDDYLPVRKFRVPGPPNPPPWRGPPMHG